MNGTTWIALFCLVGLGPAIAIRVVTLPASVAVEPARDEGRTEVALAPNEAAKSDRLELPHIRAETGIVTPAQAMPVETLAASPETTKTPDRRWEDANASASPTEVDLGSHGENASNNHKEVKDKEVKDSQMKNLGITGSGRPHRHTIVRRLDSNAGTNPPKARAEIWHCRQDAMGGLLRALDLTPRCNM
jgi:hypothetical protein